MEMEIEFEPNLENNDKEFEIGLLKEVNSSNKLLMKFRIYIILYFSNQTELFPIFKR